MDNPDFLIVGGGSAGATLASLLSQDPATRVLLIEAGADTLPDAIPADIADTFPSSYLNRDYLWPDLTARRSAAEPPRPFPQARVMGGGSSVMGLWALRGLPSDYDSWAPAVPMAGAGVMWCAASARSSVMPTAPRRSEQQAECPYPIRRAPAGEWPAFVTAMKDAAAARQLHFIDDINESAGDGFFAMPLSQDDQRASSARCYLTGAVRRRGNLAIMPQTRVTALRIDGGACAE